MPTRLTNRNDMKSAILMNMETQKSGLDDELTTNVKQLSFRDLKFIGKQRENTIQLYLCAMARTLTKQIPLGYEAPSFTLPNVVTNASTEFGDIKGEKGTVVMFICNHCPFVVHVMDGLIELGNAYKEKGFGFVAISSNDVANYPQDRPELMKELALSKGFPFAYLYDESQDVAKAYDAECTPDFSIFDANDLCVYRGQLDDSRPGNGIPVTGDSIRTALDTLERGEVLDQENQKPSIGCNIKWK